MKILRGDKTAILHAAAKAEQAVKWLRQFDPALWRANSRRRPDGWSVPARGASGKGRG
jgi:antirestriction protein ArdC